MIKEKQALKKKSQEIGISGLNSISHLEAEIMQIIWEKLKISVREVHEIMLKKEIEKFRKRVKNGDGENGKRRNGNGNHKDGKKGNGNSK